MKGIFITARMGSTRLPCKHAKKVYGQFAMQRLIDRLRRVGTFCRIVMCTTELPQDDFLCMICAPNNILYYRGSVEDKLARWQGAAKRFDIDFFVTADGDDLFCEPWLIDLAFAQYDRTNADFIECKNVPCGAFTYGIKTEALNKVCEIKGTTDTEMIEPYFKDTDLFKIEQLEGVPTEIQRPELRMTLDYPDDLKFFRRVFTHFRERPFSILHIIQYLDEHPEVAAINSHLQEKFLNNQKNKTKLVLAA